MLRNASTKRPHRHRTLSGKQCARCRQAQSHAGRRRYGCAYIMIYGCWPGPLSDAEGFTLQPAAAMRQVGCMSAKVAGGASADDRAPPRTKHTARVCALGAAPVQPPRTILTQALSRTVTGMKTQGKRFYGQESMQCREYVSTQRMHVVTTHASVCQLIVAVRGGE
jgi:hypothetical protein